MSDTPKITFGGLTSTEEQSLRADLAASAAENARLRGELAAAKESHDHDHKGISAYAVALFGRDDIGYTDGVREIETLRSQLAAVTRERNEWESSAKLYHSELRDLAAGVKVETQPGFAVEQRIAAVTQERDEMLRRIGANETAQLLTRAVEKHSQADSARKEGQA